MVKTSTKNQICTTENTSQIQSLLPKQLKISSRSKVIKKSPNFSNSSTGSSPKSSLSKARSFDSKDMLALSQSEQAVRDERYFLMRQHAMRKIQEDNLEDSFYMFDISSVRHRMNLWKRLMPRVKIFYAAKANPDDEICKEVIRQDGGFDVASAAEMEQTISLGCEPKDIIFANPIKNRMQLETARKCNVKKMTFDSAEELFKIKEWFPEAEVVLRIATVTTDSAINLNEKFGAPMDDVRMLLETCKKLNLNIIGVSFHVGSGGVSFTPYQTCLHNARSIFNMAENMGLPAMKFLDIGAGFSMLNPKQDKNFEFVATRVNDTIDKLFPLMEGVEVIGEPGTFLCESTVYMVSQIIGTKSTVDKDGKKTKNYIMNNSVHKGYMSWKFTDIMEVDVLMDPLDHRLQQERALVNSSYWGQTCEQDDIIIKDRLMPEMQLEEWVVSRDMGAYHCEFENQQSSFADPERHYIHE